LFLKGAESYPLNVSDVSGNENGNAPRTRAVLKDEAWQITPDRIISMLWGEYAPETGA
jgi:hypothetical protein